MATKKKQQPAKTKTQTKKKPAAKKTASKQTAAKKTAKQPAAKPASLASSEAPSNAGAPSSDVRESRIAALTSAFTALGAPRPERWARSHVEDGVDQIGRFVFLRALWGRVVKDGRFLDKLRKDKSELTPVVERLLLQGAQEEDLVQLVRALQVQLLVDLAQILDDPSDNDEGVRWGLWRMDKRGLPLWQLGDLRLDLLDVDPLDDM